MKKINYNSSLVKDIDNIKKKDEKLDIYGDTAIKAMLFNIPIAVGLILLSAIDTSQIHLIPCISAITAFINAYIFIVNPIEKIKQRKKQAEKSYENIRYLTFQISNDYGKESNAIISTVDPDAIINAITITKEDALEYLKTISEYIDTTKTITESLIQDYYLLDKHDNMIVLEEVSNISENKGTKQEDNSLFLLEERDLPDQLPVERRLEVK